MKINKLTVHNMERRDMILTVNKYILKLKRKFYVTTSSSIYISFVTYLKGKNLAKSYYQVRSLICAATCNLLCTQLVLFKNKINQSYQPYHKRAL